MKNHFDIPAWSLAAFNAIRWTPHPKNPESLGLKLPGRAGWIPQHRARTAFDLFWVAHERLNVGGVLTTKSICALSDPEWEIHSEFARQQIGRCFRYFAEEGVLPLRLLPSRWYPKKFVYVPANAADDQEVA